MNVVLPGRVEQERRLLDGVGSLDDDRGVEAFAEAGLDDPSHLKHVLERDRRTRKPERRSRIDVGDLSQCGDRGNELRSAELFLSVSAGAPFMFRHRVCDHILATRHSTTVRDPDRRFLVDIDLSGFGAPWDEFMRNGALLREECCDQDDVRYHFGQVAFLSRLQERRHFFATDYFRARYETTARDNLQRVLAELRSKGYGTTAPPSL